MQKNLLKTNKGNHLMKKHIVLAAVLLIFIYSSFALAQEKVDPKTQYQRVFHSITTEEISSYMDKLTSAEFNGRLAGAPGFEKSAKWVAENLKEWGLKPMGDNGTYFQMFDKPYVVVKDPGALSVSVTGKDGEILKKNYFFPVSYYPGSNSGNGTAEGEVVFLGYGLSAPELGYDDYQGIDVKGKIVVVSGGSPFDSKHEKYEASLPHVTSRAKLDNAVKHGAVAMLYTGMMANPNTTYNKELVYCHINDDVVADLFYGSGKNFKSMMEKLQQTATPESFSLGKVVKLTANTEYHPEGKGCNVIGMVEGSDPKLKEEVILVGGHLDGQGNLGGILESAWDNASGIADMMAAARALSQSPEPLKRSIMFIFIGGEECGMLGSRLYVKEPAIAQDKAVCYFNLDMVGTGDGVAVGGAMSYPLIHKIFVDANDSLIHRPFRSSETWKAGIGHPRSDSQIFKRAGYVTMSFSTHGPHPKKLAYHKVEDKKETLNYDIMEDISKLMFVGLSKMANADKLFE